MFGFDEDLILLCEAVSIHLISIQIYLLSDFCHRQNHCDQTPGEAVHLQHFLNHFLLVSDN